MARKAILMEHEFRAGEWVRVKDYFDFNGKMAVVIADDSDYGDGYYRVAVEGEYNVTYLMSAEEIEKR